eukprot:8952411-Pyramimonas_sp.AAC.1
MSQTIENTLWDNGLELTVNGSDTLPCRQDPYISARRQRRGKASADVAANINASLKMERKWAN